MVDCTEPRRIAVFTGSRAEYGLMRHLVAGIAAEPNLSLQLIVSGSHLSASHGGTLAEIEADGHKAAALVPLSLDQKPPHSMAALGAEALDGIAQALERPSPSGSSFWAIAMRPLRQRLPLTCFESPWCTSMAETTEGAVDDRLRHAITQLSTWHFTAAEPYCQRVIAMGHSPEQVFNVGPMVLMASAEPVSDRDPRGARVTALQTEPVSYYHPETLLADRGMAGFEALLKALADNPCHVLFTHPNADAGSHQLLARLQDFVQQHPQTCWAIASLGQRRYLAALQLLEAMAGNSSSGVIEESLVGMPVLNIGDRQAGRLSRPSVMSRQIWPPSQKD